MIPPLKTKANVTQEISKRMKSSKNNRYLMKNSKPYKLKKIKILEKEQVLSEIMKNKTSKSN